MVVLHRLKPSSEGAPTAVLLPGRGYTAQAPLLHWTGVVLAQNGWDVHAAEWAPDVAADDPADVVAREWGEIISALPCAPDLVVAKSLGSFAASHTIAAGIPGVWLTPLVRHDVVATALRAASATHLIVAGTADATWWPDRVSGTAAAVMEIAGADHGLQSDGDWEESYAVQRRVFARVAAHAATLPRR